MNRDMRLAAYRAVAAQCGTGYVTSWFLSKATGVHATQIRRDFRGTIIVGRRGSGYLSDAVVYAVTRELKGRETDVIFAAVAQRDLLNCVIAFGG